MTNLRSKTFFDNPRPEINSEIKKISQDTLTPLEHQNIIRWLRSGDLKSLYTLPTEKQESIEKYKHNYFSNTENENFFTVLVTLIEEAPVGSNAKPYMMYQILEEHIINDFSPEQKARIETAVNKNLAIEVPNFNPTPKAAGG